MKHPNQFQGLLIATLMSIALTAFSQSTVAPIVNGGEVVNAMLAQADEPHSAPQPIEKQPASANPPLALVIETPRGSLFRLVYVPDDGWKMIDRSAGSKTAQAAMVPTDASQPEESSSAEEPLSVFIDGPTGYTYLWIRDQGWKFVGRIADQNR